MHSRKRKQYSSQRSVDEQSESSRSESSIKTKEYRRIRTKNASPQKHDLYTINENRKDTPNSSVSFDTFQSWRSFSGNPCLSIESTCTSNTTSESSRCKIVDARNDEILLLEADFQSESCRLTLDDISYLCSTIMETKNGTSMIQHSKASAKASCELAMMLSKNKTRRILLNSGDDHISNRNNINALELVLSIFECLPTTAHHVSNQKEAQKYLSNRTRYSRTSTSLMNQSHSNTGKSLLSSNDYGFVFTCALCTIAYILSLDCTTHKSLSVSKSREASQRVQNILLSHHGILNALSKVIFDDELVQRILHSQETVSKSEDGIYSKDGRLLETNLSSQQNIKDKQLFVETSETIDTPKKRFDPTLAGRRRARKIRETPLSETNPSSDFGFPSDDKLSSNASKQDVSSYMESSLIYLEKILGQVFLEVEDESIFENHGVKDCFFCKECYVIQLKKGIGNSIEFKIQPSTIALLALSRIVTGFQDTASDESDKDCYGSDNSPKDESPVDEMSNSIPHYENDDGDEVELSNMRNPLIFKNVMLRQSGSLSFLAEAMTLALQAVYNFLPLPDNSQLHLSHTTLCDCPRCFKVLREKISTLSTILDGACCISEMNRNIICSCGKSRKTDLLDETFTVRLLSFSFKFVDVMSSFRARAQYELSSHSFCDIFTCVLRTLTSLTHDNDLAATHIVTYLDQERCLTGTSLLVLLLSEIIQAQNDMTEGLLKTCEKNLKEKRLQFFYDSFIFTLNILTNIAESSSCHEVRKAFLDTTINGEQIALIWLVQWSLAQTERFRDSVDLDRNGNDNKMDRSEGETLVTAGNCFILLACLMCRSRRNWEEEDGELKIKQQVKRMICSQFLGTENFMIEFIIKTLKAFCNYYHYSIGELSVAVIAPVTNIISELENMA